MPKSLACVGFLFGLLVTFSPAMADVPKTVHRISIEDGLSQSTVSGIAQARDGRIWFATGDGLSIYDGAGFTYIHRQFGNDNGLQSNYLSSVFRDSRNRMWVGTMGGGVTVFDTAGQVLAGFQTANSALPSDDVYDFAEDSAGRIWAGTERGVAMFLPEGSSFTVSSATLPDSGGGALSVRAVLIDRRGAVLLGTARQGLLRLAIDAGRAEWFTPEQGGLPGRKVNTLFEDSNGGIWIGTEDAGLNFMDPVTRAISRPVVLPDTDVGAIAEGDDGRLWFGTWAHGLFTYDPVSRRLENHRASIAQPYRLPSDSVIALYAARTGRMWIGTYDQGAANVSLLPDAFLSYFEDPADPAAGPLSGAVWAVAQTGDGVVWIGTKGGLSRFLPDEHRFEAVPLGSKARDVRALLPWNGRLLISLRGHGLLSYDPATGTIDEPRGPGGRNLFESRVIRLLEADHDGTLWAGTESGLLHLDENLNVLENLGTRAGPGSLPHDRIRGLYEAPDGALWIGTSGGLSRRDPQTGELESYTAPHLLPDPDVRDVLRLPDGQVLVATGGGLSILDPVSRTARFLLREHGLPNETLYGLLPETDTVVWITTNGGLVRLDLTDDSLNVYHASDGLQSSEFNFNAHAVLHDGRLAVGGVKGLSVFDPATVGTNIRPPIVSFRARPADGTESGEGTALASAPADVEFTFGVHHFERPQRNALLWKLEPLDSTWSRATGVHHVLHRPRLGPGRYEIKYQGESAAGARTPVQSYSFTVAPNVFRRWYAYIYYAFIAAMALFALSSLRMIRMRTRNAELRRKVEQKTRDLVEINAELTRSAQERAQFYARTAHEIRTPLSLMRAPLETVLRSPNLPPEEHRLIDLVGRATARLVQLTEEMANVAQEKGGLRSGHASVDFEAFIDPVLQLYQDVAHEKGVHLACVLENIGAITIDSAACETLLHNLLSNAVQNTPAGGHIRLNCALRDAKLEIRVQNDGLEIPEDVAAQMGLFAQSANTRPASKGAEIIGAVLAKSGGSLSIDRERNEIIARFPVHGQALPGPTDTPPPETGLPPVLIVEDDGEMRNYLATLLNDIAAPHAVASLAAARRAVATRAFDLILCDVMLPDGSGFDFAHEVKEHAETAHIQIVFLTALGNADARRSGRLAWADDYITKPFEVDDLRDRVQIRLRAGTTLRNHVNRQINTLGNDTPTAKGVTTAPRDLSFAETLALALQAGLSDPDFGIDQAAAACAMSRRAFQRKTDQIYGKGFSALLSEKRMEHAAHLISSGVSVTEAGKKCGYGNLSSFSRKFKSFHGVSPRNFASGDKT
ncbi:ligand-binding sensor domain-containing protein [Rhodovulum imhoffii]|uniref:histidine kinase n=1 Tax=Rhodovulum imhoffii TaxID=365340 RepID=A0A2T5BUQ1_9RHOB|nr:two-component regulator propeller domain-containing protein [Rhodovulum imhoffii]MBK5934790.1 hypothetical protein [Rhodovulum imhoffii]PTN03192.1 ligand-binding sensor domain-containing protein [Rhodovulum imhoffii]